MKNNGLITYLQVQISKVKVISLVTPRLGLNFNQRLALNTSDQKRKSKKLNSLHDGNPSLRRLHILEIEIISSGSMIQGFLVTILSQKMNVSLQEDKQQLTYADVISLSQINVAKATCVISISFDFSKKSLYN